MVDAVFTAYASGIFSIFFLLGGIFLYYIWVPLFSRYAFNRFVRENPDVNLGFSDNWLKTFKSKIIFFQILWIYGGFFFADRRFVLFKQ